jgi:hypothetical protein
MQTPNASMPVEKWLGYRRNMTVSAQPVYYDAVPYEAVPYDPDLARPAALIADPG